ncbi:hypothetical protein FF021_21510 [Leptospira noguchii]|nr:hypothetical protein FF021_21510 [Leptospira noguchii]
MICNSSHSLGFNCKTLIRESSHSLGFNSKTLIRESSHIFFTEKLNSIKVVEFISIRFWNKFL